MRLDELFDELAAAPAPPSTVTAERAYAAGQRRRRARTTARIAVTACLVVALIVTVSLTLRHAVGNRSQPARPTPTPSVSTYPKPVSLGGAVRSARAFGDHLYAVADVCTDGPCHATARKLLGSDDGGRTWTLRSGDWGRFRAEPVPVAPQVLYLDDTFMQVSVDGGRTWKEPAGSGPGLPTVGAVAPGSFAVGTIHGCVVAGTNPWVVCVLDPKAPSLAVLEHQADLIRTAEPPHTLPNGVLGVTGLDPRTRQPGVGISSDRGRTWATHVFSDLPPVTSTGNVPLVTNLASTDGRTIYCVTRHIAPQVYRSDDGGATWRRVDPDGTLGNAPRARYSYVARDGTHVIQDSAGAFWASHDRGEHYAPVPPPDGLPVEAPPVSGQVIANPDQLNIRVGPDGGYLASNPEGIYRSADGLAWHPVAVP